MHYLHPYYFGGIQVYAVRQAVLQVKLECRAKNMIGFPVGSSLGLSQQVKKR